MKITPLAIHAGVILPRHTARFSDPFAVSSIVITDDASVVISTPAPHGVPVGSAIAVSITDAETPNAITAASVDGDGNIVIETQHPHGLTTTPDPELYEAWSQLAKVSGFTSGLINGTRQVADVPDRSTFVIKPGGTVASVALNGNERLLERLEQELIGWHKVTSTGASTLSFPTPASVNRSYTAVSPVVVRNIRVWGALNHETALAHLTLLNSEATIERPHLFILPQMVEVSGRPEIWVEGSDNRMMLDDGFIVLVLIPSHDTAAHVGAIDLAHGEIFRAVMRTFHGLKIRRSEYCDPGEYRATFRSHNGAITRGARAIYAHEYVFTMPAEFRADDGVSPFEWSQIDDAGIVDGTVPTSIYPADPLPLRDLDIVGILRHGQPEPLTGSFPLDEEVS